MCLIVALGVKMLSWFDPLLCTSRTHIHRDYWLKGMGLKHGWRGTAAAVLLLCIAIVTAHRSAQTCTYTQKHRLWLSHKDRDDSTAAVVP